jgi:hypothetical protein
MVRRAPDLPGGARMTVLSEAQREAVEARGVVLVSAGAGSGKTTMLVERAARAVEDGVDPEAIFVVTFTERAAGELAERLRERLAVPGVPDRAERIQVSTIHGLCGAILREHAFALGLDPEFRVLDEASAAIVRGEALEQALAEAAEVDGGATLDLLASFGGGPLRGLMVRLRARRLSSGLDLAPEPPAPVDLDGPRAALAASAQLATEYYAERPSAGAIRNGERAAELVELLRSAATEDLVDLSPVRRSRPTRSSLPRSRPRRASSSCASCIRRWSGSYSDSTVPTPRASSPGRRSTSPTSSCAPVTSWPATATPARPCRHACGTCSWTSSRTQTRCRTRSSSSLRGPLPSAATSATSARVSIASAMRTSRCSARDAQAPRRSSGSMTASARPTRSSPC